MKNYTTNDDVFQARYLAMADAPENERAMADTDDEAFEDDVDEDDEDLEDEDEDDDTGSGV